MRNCSFFCSQLLKFGGAGGVGEPTRGDFSRCVWVGSMSTFLKTLMVGTRKIFNGQNRHEPGSFNKIQNIITILKKICVKLNEFFPIVDKDFWGSRPQIHVYKDRYLCKHNLLHLLSRYFHPANKIKKLLLCSFWAIEKNKVELRV